jgi:glycosyltransferase involved in cell wall biosynthesis
MTELCNRLVKDHDIQLIAMGLGYKGEEHYNEFRIVPCRHISHFYQQVVLMIRYNVPVMGVLVAADMPIQSAILNALRQNGVNLPYVGFFPIESAPIAQGWMPAILGMSDRIVMSEHAQAAIEDAGATAHFVPIGVSPEYKPEDDPEIIKGYREAMGVADDEFMILTVADNQERKNLSAAYEIVSKFSTNVLKRNRAGYVSEKEDLKKVKWILVTRPDSPVGWDLNDLAMRYGIMDKVTVINRGIEDYQLLRLYQSADCFLLTSKAEGLAMPVLEAMATRTPVVATHVSAIAEHLGGFDEDEMRGHALNADYAFIDCFGNGQRYFVSVDDGVDVLDIVHGHWSDKRESAQNGKTVTDWEKPILDNAQAYVNGRTWEKAAAQFAQIIKDNTPQQVESPMPNEIEAEVAING